MFDPISGSETGRGAISMILLMEEILHHLTCMKPCKYEDFYHINWCRIFSINSILKFQKNNKLVKYYNSPRSILEKTVEFQWNLSGHQLMRVANGNK